MEITHEEFITLLIILIYAIPSIWYFHKREYFTRSTRKVRKLAWGYVLFTLLVISLIIIL